MAKKGGGGPPTGALVAGAGASAAVALLSVILLVAVSAAAAYLFVQNTEAKARISALEGSVAGLNSSLSAAVSNLGTLNADYASQNALLRETQADYTSLRMDDMKTKAQLASTGLELNRTKAELALARSELSESEARVEQIKQEVGALDESINSSLAWFKENSQLPETGDWVFGTFKDRMLTDCTNGSDLNLACVAYLMEKTTISFKYKSEGNADHLQSLEEMLANGGGDCEDFSLFMKAVLNYAKAEKSGLQLVGYAPGTGSFMVWPLGGLGRSNTKAAYLGDLDSLEPVVICYGYDDTSGHCTVALSKAHIGSTADIPKLDSARVFEPQSGQYLGAVGTKFTLCGKGMDYCEGAVNHISFVITDKDLYQFIDGEWAGFENYALEVRNVSKSLG